MSTSTPRPTTSVSTAELYDRWSSTYDTDGNILQALDDHLFPPLLLSALTHLASTSPSIQPLTITELGAGTGRNTIKLLTPPLPVKTGRVIALDLSPRMLDLARRRCEVSTSSTPAERPAVEFHVLDALSPPASGLEAVLGEADVVVSTLVLEHLPLRTFLRTVTSLLKEAGGLLVLTNMHADMGRVGQAGFWDEDGGVKVRGESYVYEVDEVVLEGREMGFEVVGEVLERGVGEADLGDRGILGPRGRKWIGVNCWFGCVMRFNGNEEMGRAS